MAHSLYQDEPKNICKSLKELLASSLVHNHLEAAMSVYSEIYSLQDNNCPLPLLDAQGVDDLIEKLAEFCEIVHLKTVLKTTPLLTERALVLAAEPIIMAGELSWFANIFERFLAYTPNSYSAGRVIRAIVLGRSRRLMSQTDTTDDERLALGRIFQMIEAYHEVLVVNDPAAAYTNELYFQKDVDCVVSPIFARLQVLSHLPSSFATRQLYEMERFELNANPDNVTNISDEETFFLRMTPQLEHNANFKYVGEDRNIGLDLELDDLTSHLASKYPNNMLIMTGDLFEAAEEEETGKLRQSMSSETLLGELLDMVNGDKKNKSRK
jgi:hypothetical protein